MAELDQKSEIQRVDTSSEVQTVNEPVNESETQPANEPGTQSAAEPNPSNGDTEVKKEEATEKPKEESKATYTPCIPELPSVPTQLPQIQTTPTKKVQPELELRVF